MNFVKWMTFLAIYPCFLLPCFIHCLQMIFYRLNHCRVIFHTPFVSNIIFDECYLTILVLQSINKLDPAELHASTNCVLLTDKARSVTKTLIGLYRCTFHWTFKHGKYCCQPWSQIESLPTVHIHHRLSYYWNSGTDSLISWLILLHISYFINQLVMHRMGSQLNGILAGSIWLLLELPDMAWPWAWASVFRQAPPRLTCNADKQVQGLQRLRIVYCSH